MNQKRFVNILLIVLVVILAGTVGYLTLVNKALQPTPNINPSPTSTPPSTTTNTQIIPPTSTKKPDTGKLKKPSTGGALGIPTIIISDTAIANVTVLSKQKGESVWEVRIDNIQNYTRQKTSRVPVLQEGSKVFVNVNENGVQDRLEYNPCPDGLTALGGPKNPEDRGTPQPLEENKQYIADLSISSDYDSFCKNLLNSSGFPGCGGEPLWGGNILTIESRLVDPICVNNTNVEVNPPGSIISH